MLYRVTARSRDGCFVKATGIWTVRACTRAEAISMARLIASRSVWPPGSFWSVDLPTRQLDLGAESKPVRDANGVGSRFRPTMNHKESGLPENDSRPLAPV
jgi:hypothetical protein